MKYTKKQFLEDVKHEATMLRNHATVEEKNKLNLDNLFPKNRESCIYGQITGDCRNNRSIFLIKKSCRRYTINDGTILTGMSTEYIQNNMNGEKMPRSMREGLFCHFSSIEAYILLPKAKNKNLISYIKGETDTLTL